MIKRLALFFHRIDFDGICALAIIRSHFMALGWEVVVFPYNRGDEVPSLETLLGFDAVVVVDISLPDELMKALASVWRESTGTASGLPFRFVWIDHHRSSVKDSYKGGWNDVPGLRALEDGDRKDEHVVRKKLGACELAWMWCHPGVKVPYVVRLLSAYDVWDKERFSWDGLTLPFQYGMRQMFSNRAEEFCEAWDEARFDEDFAFAVAENGRLILSYARESGERGVASYGFEVEVGDGHRGVCCLTNQFGALAFGEALRKSGATISVCVNRIRADEFYVSLFGTEENTLDLGAYCKEHYRGGGHFSAAGGRMTFEEFTKLNFECKL